MQMHIKTPLEIQFIYLSDKEIYCSFKKCCIVCFIFHKMLFIS
jgi:hypothetical protein